MLIAPARLRATRHAVRRAGLSTVVLPARNRKDYDDIPESARNSLRFLWAEPVDDVTEAALEPTASIAARAAE